MLRWVLAVAVPLPAAVLGAIGLRGHHVNHVDLGTALWQLPVLLIPLVLVMPLGRTHDHLPPVGGPARRAPLALAVALPGLVLAGIGLFHPDGLDEGNAQWWWQMHLLLLPLFPLLGVTAWALLRGERGPLAWVARIGAYVFGTFYLALDIVVGIVMGKLIETFHGQDDVLRLISTIMRAAIDYSKFLAIIGHGGLIVAITLAGVLAVRRYGPRAVPGAVLLCGGNALFVNNHIYWPQGGLAMIGFAAGAFLLVMARRPAAPPQPDPASVPDSVPAAA